MHCDSIGSKLLSDKAFHMQASLCQSAGEIAMLLSSTGLMSSFGISESLISVM